MKRVTSAAANKMIRKLEDEKLFLLANMNESATYIEAEGSEPIIPEFDYLTTQHEILEIDNKIMKIKHAVNQFNVETVIPEIELTIDQALVKMAQLNAMKNTLDRMRKRLPKSRYNAYGTTNVIQYECINYSIDDVKQKYDEISDYIIEIQMGLDKCNQTIEFDLDV